MQLAIPIKKSVDEVKIGWAKIGNPILRLPLHNLCLPESTNPQLSACHPDPTC